MIEETIETVIAGRGECSDSGQTTMRDSIPQTMGGSYNEIFQNITTCFLGITCEKTNQAVNDAALQLMRKENIIDNPHQVRAKVFYSMDYMDHFDQEVKNEY